MSLLAGKVVIVTGGGSGIGRAAAILFAQEGAQVCILDRDIDLARQTAALIEGNAAVWQTDVADEAGVARTTDAIVARFGPRRVAMVLLSLASVGVLMVGYAPMPEIALAGFALMGIGCSAVYPLAVSAAAQRTDRPSAVNVAAIGQVTFIVFFLAPPLLGFIAEHAGIRTSYLVCLPLIIYALFSVKALAPRRQSHGLVQAPAGGVPSDHLPM